MSLTSIYLNCIFDLELLPLPDGWKEVKPPEGQVIYIDYNTMKFQLNRPTNGKISKNIEIV